MGKILIVDDEEIMCEALADVVKSMGHIPVCALTLFDGLEKASSESFDIVFLDVMMPDGNGLDLLPNIKAMPSSPEVIIITGSGEPEGAELAIRSGAWDYIQKTSSVEKMSLSLTRALQYREKMENTGRTVALKREGILGNSTKMKDCLDLLARAANSTANVLLTGESGTGKELFALAIHKNSLRADRNFIVVDCAALPETLVESLLFGHEKGTFTGADKSEKGMISHSDAGTLFLDEVGELPLSVQKAFLRVLQEHRYRPLGARFEVESNFRLVAATNRDLDEMAETGRFRKDLLFRLKSVIIDLPPLRDREADIKELSVFYVTRICERNGMETKGFSPEFFEALLSYDWPGNVRELVNTLEAAITSAGNQPILFSRHLPMELRIRLVRDSVKVSTPYESDQHKDFSSDSSIPPLKNYREEMDRRYFMRLLTLTQGNVKKAVKVSELSQSRFYALLRKYKTPILDFGALTSMTLNS